MAKQFLTDYYIRGRARPLRGNAIDYDTDVVGFAVRFAPSGPPTFLFCYGIPYAKGVKRRMAIGRWSAASGKTRSSLLGEMRQRARELRIMVDAKRDPYADQAAEAKRLETERADQDRQRIAAEAARAAEKAEMEAARNAEDARLTVAQLCALYTDPNEGHPMRPDTARRVQRRIERYLIPSWGDRKADTITCDDVLALLKPVRRAGKRSEVVHVLSLVSGVYSWARSEKVLKLADNPAEGVFEKLKKADELPESRDRALTTATEFRAFWHVTNPLADVSPGSPMHPDVAECLRFMLFTGARPSEAAGLTWAEVDMKFSVWNKPKQGEGRSKSKRGDTLPLVGQVMAILRSREGNGSQYVFPSGRNRRVVNGCGAGCLTANRLATGLRVAQPYCAAQAIEPFTPHDVRRTLATGMNEIGVSSDVVERTLNHAVSKLKKTYDQSRQTRIRRRAMEAWVHYFAEVVRTGKTIDDWEDEALPQTDNVLQFPAMFGGR